MLGVNVQNRYVDSKSGYVKLYLENQKVVDEHRYIITNLLNRKLEFNEIVHHKDGDKQNNDILNLELISRKVHTRNHISKKEEHMYMTLNCTMCGCEFAREIRYYKRSIKIKQINFFCSRSCQVKHQHKMRSKK